MLTFREAKQRCGNSQMRLQRTDFGEYRVTPFIYAPQSDEAENLAYYTNDLEDAMITASQMARGIQFIH